MGEEALPDGVWAASGRAMPRASGRRARRRCWSKMVSSKRRSVEGHGMRLRGTEGSSGGRMWGEREGRGGGGSGDRGGDRLRAEGEEWKPFSEHPGARAGAESARR